ncbi:MAG: SDR family oxidoreductase [Bryobacteraceae bacterium]|nr:SDR family oxidoreductase [Bryobacteraceae bacterium]MDW8377439.1 SDR family NAD(P)-dependent oxidoreductase [Bryobacterales bacterium]
MNLDFSGKLAVVTGGAHGIGAATARQLAGAQAQVVIFDREDGAALAADLGGRFVAVDVTDRSQLASALAQVGPPDVMVINAGTVLPAPLEEITEASWRQVLEVNLTGAFFSLQAAAACMRPRRKGAIVFTASTNSYDGEASLTSYNASKAGILGLLHTAANELGPYGIRVNAVCPGLIRTRLTESYFAQPAVLKDYFRAIPLGRGGEPEEVARAIVFLASDAASFITGATLLVDGGQMACKFATWKEPEAEFRGDHWRLCER